jgi:uncharacterized protein (TIGR01777 family)
VKVAVTGSSGLIGSHLVASLRRNGHDVITLVRRLPRHPKEVQWDPGSERFDPADLEGIDAAINLAGPGIGDKRWTPSYRQAIRDARIRATDFLATTMAGLDPKPAVLLSGSAIGFYGDRGDTPLTEADTAGSGFLADLCVAWENATRPAEEAGLRVCTLRTGIVLSRAGGALAKQLPLYRAGLGGPLGSGTQYQSWISLHDDIAAIEFLLTAADVTGPVNLTAPNPLRHRDFARALGRAVHRPALLPTPRLAVRLALGEFADEGVLAGQRVLPRVLIDAGFRFSEPDIDAGLSAALRD